MTVSYTFGINVESAQELDSISVKVRDFIRTVGEGSCDIQVAINPALGEPSPKIHGEGAPAIGFVYEGELEEYYDEGDV